MGWPIESDYFDAIQNPKFCFDDPELKTGQVTTNALGLPKSITGAFASVYQLKCPNGRKWAVRCFLREIADQQVRYGAISQKLQAIKLPYTVGFEFLPRGIVRNGAWYPILKMEWLEGVPLDRYVESNLSNPQILQSLAKQWIAMTSTLRESKIAHGDLQHGNILVCNGNLKLIDYDGMYVPQLKWMHSNEQGHPNYQHPRRGGSDFNENLDNFSAWLIFISLSTFAIEPRLWRSLGCGDEHLLFRRADLERPASSKVFRALDTSGKPQLQSLAAHLRTLLCLPLKDIPALDGLPVHPTSRSVVGGRPDWLEDHVPEEKLETLQQQPPVPKPMVTGADWIFDHLVNEPPPLPVLSVMSVASERIVLVLGCSIVSSIALYTAASYSFLLALIMIIGEVAASLGFLRYRFRGLSIVEDSKKLFAKIAEGHRSISQIENAIQTVNGERSRVIEPLADLDHRYRTVPQRLAHTLQSIRRTLDQSLSDLSVSRSAVDQTEFEALRRLEASSQKIRADLLMQRNNLRAGEQNELSSALADLRKTHVWKYLQMHDIRAASIPGIGPKLINELGEHGILTAAGIDSRVYSVRGIGQAKAMSLIGWRKQIEWEAGRTMPQELAAYETTVIKSKYSRQMQDLERRIAESGEAQIREYNAIGDSYMSERHKLIQQEESLRQKAERDSEEARAKYKLEKDQLAQRFRSEEAKANAVRKDLDAKLAELSHSVFKKRAEIHQLQREYQRYQGVTFSAYLRKVCGIRRAA
jgi:hypothetical protein